MAGICLFVPVLNVELETDCRHCGSLLNIFLKSTRVANYPNILRYLIHSTNIGCRRHPVHTISVGLVAV